MIRIDGYADIERIGQGGLGDVYRATRTSTGGSVAVKVLRDVSDESVAWHRTRRELTALVALAGHANVIQLLEMLTLPEGPALVMEYAPGGSVAGLLRERDATLTVAEVVLIGRHTAAALVAAHELGIVHRDIKPQNLLIDAYGQVKLCDFGVAALTASDDFRTRTTALSMRYASPEDLDDEVDVGPPSDVYSLGATLLHLARGAPPTLKDRLAAWTAPPTEDGELARLDDVIASCLHPSPDARPTAADVLDALERLDWALGERRRSLAADGIVPPEPVVADDPPASVPDDDPTTRRGDAPPIPPASPALEPDAPPSRTRWIVAGLVALALGAAVAAFVWWPDDGGEETPTTTAAVIELADDGVAESAIEPTIDIVERPDALTAIDDASIIWPFGAPGECLVQRADADELQTVACDEPHDLQRYAVAELDAAAFPPGAAYDAAALRDAVDRACRTAFEPFVGTAYDDSEFDAPFTLPSATTWLEGDRRYQCLLGVAGSRLVGDATGVGR